MPENLEEEKIQKMINDLVEKAKKASQEYMKLNQEQIDNIVKTMSMAGYDFLRRSRSRTSHGISKNGSRRNRKRNI